MSMTEDWSQTPMMICEFHMTYKKTININI
jgi:hypothetical protein